MPVAITLVVSLFLLRVLYRTVLDFPPYPGFSPLQGTNVDGLMDEDRFWALIHGAHQRSHGNYEQQIEELTELLEGELPADIIAFQRAFVALFNRANHFRHWERAYALNGGCSDDLFHYFCTWWIGQGKNKFYWSLRFPRLLFFFAVRESSLQTYEGLEYCADKAYQHLTGRELPFDRFEYTDTGGRQFNEHLAVLKHPELAFFAW
ncbi:MAG: DUF4240 domain-containing protein [Pseudomonadota bacterium]